MAVAPARPGTRRHHRLRIGLVMAGLGCGPRVLSEGSSGEHSGGHSGDDADGDGEVDDDGGLPPPTADGDTTSDEPPPTGPFEAVVCPDVVVESAYCLASRQSSTDIAIVGVDSGTACAVAVASEGPIESLAWIGDAFYYCDPTQQTAIRFDLWTGATQSVAAGCSAITELDDQLLVVPGLGSAPQDPVRIYTDWSVLTAAGDPVGSFSAEMNATRFGAGNGIFYGAWHSTYELDRFDVAGDFGPDPLQLVDHDDWVFGLDHVGGQIIIATRGYTLRVFDAETGARVRDVTMSEDVWGLACRPGR